MSRISVLQSRFLTIFLQSNQSTMLKVTVAVAVMLLMTFQQGHGDLLPGPEILQPKWPKNSFDSGTQVRLEWTAVQPAKSYYIELKEFVNSKPIGHNTTDTKFFFIAPCSKRVQSEYNWRVAAVDESGTKGDFTKSTKKLGQFIVRGDRKCP